MTNKCIKLKNLKTTLIKCKDWDVKITVTYYIGVFLICYTWLWTHIYNIMDLI